MLRGDSSGTLLVQLRWRIINRLLLNDRLWLIYNHVICMMIMMMFSQQSGTSQTQKQKQKEKHDEENTATHSSNPHSLRAHRF